MTHNEFDDFHSDLLVPMRDFLVDNNINPYVVTGKVNNTQLFFVKSDIRKAYRSVPRQQSKSEVLQLNLANLK